MRFETPDGTAFEFPDEWWNFADMPGYSRHGARCYPVDGEQVDDLIPISEVEPPQRDPGIVPFKKSKLVPILMAVVSSNAIPPVQVKRLGNAKGRFRYGVHDGSIGTTLASLSAIRCCRSGT